VPQGEGPEFKQTPVPQKKERKKEKKIGSLIPLLNVFSF
jgi:hypothetical protein